ncbi:Putative phage tail tape measure protein TMP [Mycobacteroides abscessus subsp. abscessus]|uniref:phage tail tape measure protein n=4 Tax=Mycobacteroides abscessus TaxID=36809 RepID=UPI0005E8D161|nr:Putative phage tail tape measure protein TMP [Mycobacteroides abscessus]SIF72191.1 Putative phage tail tape measure protein TMP [Mycobacteroides abscessus subsp. abscessus]SIH03350.1 Putative phage tail tape measure protein TMP [Mycobacteroides abscessus subsp. abscessus]
MAQGMDFGYYTLPVIPSFVDIESKSQTALNRSVGALGTKVGKTFGKNLADGVVSAEAQLTRAYDNVIKIQDKAADATGKLATAEAKLQRLQKIGASNDRIVAATEARNKARRDEIRAVKEATAAQDDYERSLKRHNSGADALDNLGLSYEGLAGKASLAAAALGTAVGAGMAAAAAGAIKLGRELYDLGAQFDETFDQLQITTGASGGALDAFEVSVKNLGRSVPLPFAELGKVVGEVNRDLHLTGPTLDAVSKSVANLGRLTGEAVDVRGLGRAFRSFGVEGKDQVATLDSLFGAWQRTGIPINELLSTVTKGGPQLRQFGFTFGQSAALIGTLDEAGLDAEKSLMALNKAMGVLAKKEGITGPEALKKTVAQIKALTDAGRDTEAINLTNKIFGPKGGGQFLDAIRRGALDLQTLQSALDSTGASINDTASDTDDFEQKWQIFKNNTAAALEPLASSLFAFVNDGLGSLAVWVQAHQPEVIGFFSTATQGVILFGETILRMASDALDALSLLVGGLGNTVGFTLKAASAFASLTGDKVGAQRMHDLSEDAFSWGENMRGLADKLDGTADGLFNLRKRIQATGEEMATAAKFTSALGEATASIPDGKTIQISENTPEVRRKLADIGVQVETLPDGTVTVTANTDQGKKVLESWRKSIEHDKPAEVPITADTSEAEHKWALFRDMLQNPGPTPVTGPFMGGNANANAPWIPFLPPPRARGGIFDVWDSVASFAKGGTLPKRAVIQPAVAGSGLVQWAEPSTGGEAFIPLDGGQRSIDIWIETGRRLGLMRSYEQGGVNPGLNPGADYLRSLVMQMWPQITRIGGRRSEDGFGEHSSGNALDIMIPNYDSPQGKALGDSVAAFLVQNASALDLNGFIWRQQSYGYGGSFTTGKPMSNRGDDTQNHMDHVHVILGAGRGVNATAVGLPKAPLVGSGGVSVGSFPSGNLSGGAGGGRGGGSVFGAGYQTGRGTPGYDEDGRPGYYAPDPKQVREAEERAADAQQRIKDADAQVKIAEARKSELDFDASESQKLSADTALEKAKADAAKARREAQDSQADLAEAQRGKFTAAKESKKGKGGDDLSDIGRIIGGGFAETFGLDGSVFPNIEELGIVKLAKAILGIKYTPQGTGFAGGLLAGGGGGGGGLGGPSGVFGGAAFDGGGATSGLPFGMVPEVSSMLPSLTGGTAHPGSGMPPGVGNGPVDQSLNVTINNPQGDERSIADRTRRVLLNTPRQMTHEPIGGGP